MEAQGHSGTAEFDGRTVTIRREGQIAKTLRGLEPLVIPLEAVTGVEWKKPGMLTNGHLTFKTAGWQETKYPNLDPQTVVVTYQQRKAFEVLLRAIEDARRQVAPAHSRVAPARDDH